MTTSFPGFSRRENLGTRLDVSLEVTLGLLKDCWHCTRIVHSMFTNFKRWLWILLGFNGLCTELTGTEPIFQPSCGEEPHEFL